MTTTKEIVTMLDIHGRTVHVPMDDIVTLVAGDLFRFFGMNGDAILEMRKQYCLRRGAFPATVESIKEMFDGPDKSSTSRDA